MKRKINKVMVLISIIFSIVMIITAAIITYNVFNRTTASIVIEGTRDEKWLSDLQFVKEQLPKKHKNLFFSLDEEQFYEEMDLLISHIPEYDDQQLTGELARLINKVGDSHTTVDIRGAAFFPFSFFEYEEGIFINNVSLEYKSYWGAELTAVNGYSIEELKKMLSPYLSADNEAIFKNEFCNALKYPMTLRIAGILKTDEVVYTIRIEDVEKQLEVKAISFEEAGNVIALTDVQEEVTLFPIVKQKRDLSYWFEYIEDEKMIYVRYNACNNMKDYSFREFTKDVFGAVDQYQPEALILDLRDNGGGNSMIFSPFLRQIKKRDNINMEDSLYVIIGRQTFSSAILNAMDLRNKTNAILIGEATGGKPNHYGEVKRLNLSNTGVTIYYSSNYFKTTSEDLDAVYPDIEVRTTAASFFSGLDDVLTYIIDEKENKSID